MAVTITRSVWIDDDGTGTTGTVINQALHTTLYNEIDTALAKVAQLAGGNTFTGTQTIAAINSAAVLQVLTASAERMRITATGELCVGVTANTVGASIVAVAADGGVRHGIAIQNLGAANTINFLYCFNSAGAPCGGIIQAGATGVSFPTTSDARLKDDGGRAADVTALRAVVVHDFTWTADGVRDRGVFAQEAHAHYPRAVVAGTDERTEGGDLARPWMTDYSKFVPDLIVGWQQHDADLAELRAILAAVKG
jgi:hypothetical protein